MIETAEGDGKQVAAWLRYNAVNTTNLTGSMAGSYFGNEVKAKEFFIDSNGGNLIHQGVLDGKVNERDFALALANENYEWLDMTARVLAVYNATNYVISKVADENNQVVFW